MKPIANQSRRWCGACASAMYREAQKRKLETAVGPVEAGVAAGVTPGPRRRKMRGKKTAVPVLSNGHDIDRPDGYAVFNLPIGDGFVTGVLPPDVAMRVLTAAAG